MAKLTNKQRAQRIREMADALAVGELPQLSDEEAKELAEVLRELADDVERDK